jgi:hypothetical protein
MFTFIHKAKYIVTLAFSLSLVLCTPSLSSSQTEESTSLTEDSMREFMGTAREVWVKDEHGEFGYLQPVKSDLPLPTLINACTAKLVAEKPRSVVQTVGQDYFDMIMREKSHPEYVSMIHGTCPTESFVSSFRRLATAKFGQPMPLALPLYRSHPLAQFTGIQDLLTRGQPVLQEILSRGTELNAQQFMRRGDFFETTFTRPVMISCNFSPFHNYLDHAETSFSYCTPTAKSLYFEFEVKDFLIAHCRGGSTAGRVQMYVDALNNYTKGYITGETYHILIKANRLHDLMRITGARGYYPESVPQGMTPDQLRNLLLQKKTAQARVYLSAPAMLNGDILVNMYRTLRDANMLQQAEATLDRLLTEDFNYVKKG